MLTTLLLLLAMQDASAPPRDAPPEKCPAGLTGLACAPDKLGKSIEPPCSVNVQGQLLYPPFATPIPHTSVDFLVFPPMGPPYTIERYTDAWNQFKLTLPPSPGYQYLVYILAEGVELFQQKLFVPAECKPGPGIDLDVLVHFAVKPADTSEDTVAVETLAQRVPGNVIESLDRSMDKKSKSSPQETEAALQKIVSTAPDYYDASLQLGLEYKTENQAENAIKSLTHALEVNPGSMLARTTLGEYAFDAGNFQSAADLLSQAARLGSTSPDLYFMLGTSYYKLNRLDLAEAYLWRALSIAPSIGKVYLQLYNVYMKAKMPDKALAAAQTYLDKYPNAGDRAYVQSMVDKLRKPEKPNQ